MSQSRRDARTEELRAALEHAQRLTDPRPERHADHPAWSAQAAHVGDLSVLALAMRD